MFPQRNWLGFPIGWKDLGNVNPTYVRATDTTTVECCGYCHATTRVGKTSDDELFKFCPQCEEKLK